MALWVYFTTLDGPREACIFSGTRFNAELRGVGARYREMSLAFVDR